LQRLLKFLHTIGAIGFMGSLACLLVLDSFSPPPTSLAGYAAIREAMGMIAKWVFFPSFFLTLVPGLVAIAVTPAFQNAGWVWIKAASGIPVFAGGLHALGAIQDEARFSAEAVAGRLDPAKLAGVSDGTAGIMWVLLALSTVNVVLAIWRQRIKR
jgi:hypothetical protein